MAADQVDVEAIRRWLREFARLVESQRDELSALDAAIGDADHGANLARGMAAVLARALDERTIGGTAKAAAMALIGTVGGASGPLYGTFFLRFGAAAADAEAVDAVSLGRALRAGVEGLTLRGKAVPGDKTMVDALAPAVDAFDQASAAGLQAALAAAADAAERGRDATVPMVARKGRASYLGDRSAGHADPGATSAALLLRAAAGTLG